MSFRVRDSAKKTKRSKKVDDGVPAAALPVYSVDTIDDAKTLQVTVCKKSYDGRYIWFYPDRFSGEVDELDSVTEKLDNLYQKWKEEDA